jgi:16S rRNA (cytidine1402-2'-O)-methyltransferase
MQDAPQPSPPGTLAIVATPIGNLRDITQRALDVLRGADLIGAEDTRNSQHLLSAFGIQARLMAVHEHNEAAVAGRIVEALQAGQRVAYISDAGTPGLSDPGARLVQAVRAAGLPVLPVPGASALAAAVSVSGLEGPFQFQGFLPPKAAARRKVLESLRDLPVHLVFYEAPHRIEETVADLVAVLGEARTLVFARELTKRFEQVYACPLGEAGAWLAADDNHRRGEFVLVVAAPPKAEDVSDQEARRVLEVLLEELSVKQAAQLAARLTGGRKNDLYDLALEIKKATPT